MYRTHTVWEIFKAVLYTLLKILNVTFHAALFVGGFTLWILFTAICLFFTLVSLFSDNI